MAEYVDKEDVILACVEKGQKSKRYKVGEFWELNGSEIREALSDVPAADVAPIKHAKWIDKSSKKLLFGRVLRDRIVQCDQCRNYLDMDGVNGGRGDANYCPNCGARMDAKS